MIAISRRFVAVGLGLTLATGACQPGSGTASPSASTTAKPTPTDDRPYQQGKPVLAVKIDNVATARPPTGLGDADIVYVEPVEAGLSRLLAVYGTRQPKTVGPVRSARASDLELLRQFGHPAFAYSGARSSVLDDIRRAPLADVSPAHAGNAYTRRGPHRAPHNLYADPSRLRDRAGQAEPPGDIGFRYGAAPAGGKATKARSVEYKAFRVGFSWSEQQRRWLVQMDGRAHVTRDGGRSAAATVVVQYVDIEPRGPKDKFGNVSPYVTTTGDGKATVLRDGKAYDARWSRPRADAGTRYTTAEGKPMRFADGQVWVVFAKR